MSVRPANVSRKYFNAILIAISLSSTPTSSSTAVAVAVAARDPQLINRVGNVCAGDATLSPCGRGLQNSFCCSSGSSCIALNDNNGAASTSTICCPRGANCQQIRPITCDISLQNATAAPRNAVHTTNLTAILESCGGLCCPLGYTCTGSTCSMIAGAVIPSPTPSSSSSFPSSSYSTAAPTSTSTSTTSAGPSSSHKSGISPGTIAGVTIACLAFGAFLAIFCVHYFRRRAARKRALARSRNLTGAIHSRNFSEPIYHKGFGARTDFLRRDVSGAGKSVGMREANGMSEGSKTRTGRTASSETIDVVMPPPVPSYVLGRYLDGASTVGGSSATAGEDGGNINGIGGSGSRTVSQGTIGTTFSQLLEGAGLGRESRANLRALGRR